MYKHILIPTDGSEHSREAVAHGVALAKAMGARVTAMTVSTPFHIFTWSTEMLEETPSEHRQHNEDTARAALGAARALAQTAGVPLDTVHVEDDNPYRAIGESATARGCDAIVMASYGRGAKRARDPAEHPLDSETVRVLSHANIPVVVYP
jgi:nucleotide-binding universal stress UspA family protein